MLLVVEFIPSPLDGEGNGRDENSWEQIGMLSSLAGTRYSGIARRKHRGLSRVLQFSVMLCRFPEGRIKVESPPNPTHYSAAWLTLVGTSKGGL